MLLKQDKIKLYGLVTSEFDKGVDYPLSKVSKYLTDNGLDYQEFGYKKLKNLLLDLPEFLTLTSYTDEKGLNRDVVRIHDFGVEEKPAPISKKKSFPNADMKKEAHVAPSSKASYPLFSEEIQDNITKLTISEFRKGETYPLAKIALYLTGKGIRFRDYGFTKFYLMLQAMPSLFSVSDDQGMITVLKGNSKKAVVPVSKKKENIKPIEEKKKAKPAEVKKVAKTEKISLNTKYEKFFYLPEKLALSLKEQYGVGLGNSEIEAMLLDSYKKAKKENELIDRNDAEVFPIPFTGKNGEPLIGSVKKAGAGAGFEYYVNFVGVDREKPKDYLKNRVHFESHDSYDKAIRELAVIAKTENWGYHNSQDPYIILKIYIQYTFYRIVTQNKLVSSSNGDFLAFNTGLVSPQYEDIYGVLLRSKDSSINEPYLFQGFTIAGTQGLGKIIVEHFNPLPQKATYIESQENFFYDSNATLHTDYTHILLDNLDRFPIGFLKKMMFPFKKESELINLIEKCKNEYKRENTFDKLEALVEKNDTLLGLLKISLIASIDRAKAMVRNDFRMGLPSFFPTREVISIMLPLEFTPGNGPEAVLLVEKTQSGNYQGQTILTLKQCYVNARLLGPLTTTYLDPKKIED